MSKLSLVLILVFSSMLLPDLALGAEPVPFLSGPGGNPADIGRTGLWLDNPDFAGPIGSSEVIGAYALWSEIANDFVLSRQATIKKVTWWGQYWDNFTDPTGSGFNLRYYYDAGCVPEDTPFLEILLPGDPCCELPAGDGPPQYVYELRRTLQLPAGAYWFSAQMADHPYPPQWGRQGAEVTQACQSMFRSPYFAYPDWTIASDVFGTPYEASQMFEGEWGAPGACCFGEICEVISEAQCTEWGGTWMGLPSCVPVNPCTAPLPGACCLEGSYCEIMLEHDCHMYGGQWDGYHACHPNPCPRDQRGPACPPPGLDVFDDTWAAFWFSAPALPYGPRAIIAHGPTAVLRSARTFDAYGRCTINTEILELSLTGVLNPDCRDPLHEHRVTINLDPLVPTYGAIGSSSYQGDPDFPDQSFFDVYVTIDVEGVGVFRRSVADMGSLLNDGDLWANPPCVHPSDPYQPPTPNHAHIPCPEVCPPRGCCILDYGTFYNEFYTFQVLCEALGGTYLGDNVDCPDGCPYNSGVEDEIVQGIAIGEITPNPSFGTVQLTYGLEAAARTQIDLFDASGRLVRSYAIEEQGIGEHEFVWDGKDRQGRDLPAGVYFLTLRAGEVKTTRAIVLLR